MAEKSKSKKLAVASNLPPLYHRLPGEEYSTKKSEVIQWLIQRPSILEFLWDHVKQSGLVFYNQAIGKWQGVNYED